MLSLLDLTPLSPREVPAAIRGHVYPDGTATSEAPPLDVELAVRKAELLGTLTWPSTAKHRDHFVALALASIRRACAGFEPPERDPDELVRWAMSHDFDEETAIGVSVLAMVEQHRLERQRQVPALWQSLGSVGIRPVAEDALLRAKVSAAELQRLFGIRERSWLGAGYLLRIVFALHDERASMARARCLAEANPLLGASQDDRALQEAWRQHRVVAHIAAALLDLFFIRGAVDPVELAVAAGFPDPTPPADPEARAAWADGFRGLAGPRQWCEPLLYGWDAIAAPLLWPDWSEWPDRAGLDRLPMLPDWVGWAELGYVAARAHAYQRFAASYRPRRARATAFRGDEWAVAGEATSCHVGPPMRPVFA